MSDMAFCLDNKRNLFILTESFTQIQKIKGSKSPDEPKNYLRNAQLSLPILFLVVSCLSFGEIPQNQQIVLPETKHRSRRAAEADDRYPQNGQVSALFENGAKVLFDTPAITTI